MMIIMMRMRMSIWEDLSISWSHLCFYYDRKYHLRFLYPTWMIMIVLDILDDVIIFLLSLIIYGFLYLRSLII